MGSVGVGASGNNFINTKTNDSNDIEGLTMFSDEFTTSAISGTDKWFANPKLSNYEEWFNSTTGSEMAAIQEYTGADYKTLNRDLYEKKWDNIASYKKATLAAIYNSLNKFELNKAINVSRGTYAEYFGGVNSVESIKKFLNDNNGILQFNGFQSTSTGSKPAFNKPIVLHYTIPPSKGAGAYIRPISKLPNEKEFLVNSNSVFQFDPNSVHQTTDGKIHISAVWIGQAADQAFTEKK